MSKDFPTYQEDLKGINDSIIDGVLEGKDLTNLKVISTFSNSL